MSKDMKSFLKKMMVLSLMFVLYRVTNVDFFMYIFIFGLAFSGFNYFIIQTTGALFSTFIKVLASILDVASPFTQKTENGKDFKYKNSENVHSESKENISSKLNDEESNHISNDSCSTEGSCSSAFDERAERIMFLIASYREYEILKKIFKIDDVWYHVRTSNGDCIIKFVLINDRLLIQCWRCDGSGLITIAYNGCGDNDSEVVSAIDFDSVEYEIYICGDNFDCPINDYEEVSEEECCDNNESDNDQEEEPEYEEEYTYQPSSKYYSILGLYVGASQNEIKKAYIKLSRKYHPDVNKSKGATVKMQDINEAYNALKAA